MRGLIYTSFCMVILLFFVGLSMMSTHFNWPIWLSALLFIVAVIVFTYLMSRLVLHLRLSKQSQQAKKLKESNEDEA